MTTTKTTKNNLEIEIETGFLNVRIGEAGGITFCKLDNNRIPCSSAYVSPEDAEALVEFLLG